MTETAALDKSTDIDAVSFIFTVTNLKTLTYLETISLQRRSGTSATLP